MPRRAGDLAARSLQSQSDLYSRSRSRSEIATVSARSRAASALINSRHRLAYIGCAIATQVPEGILDEGADEAPADETGDGDGD